MRMGWIGTAGLAADLARRLRDAGHTVRICGGAGDAATPAEAVRGAEVVGLGPDADLEAVLGGPEGIAAGIAAGAVVVDHGPTPVARTRRAATELAGHGAIWS
jgi:3-hydroxyisobutyrate dehydrogenase-like beta-hydroxyacid dehydrogenase